MTERIADNPIAAYMESREGPRCPICDGKGAHYLGCTYGFDAEQEKPPTDRAGGFSLKGGTTCDERHRERS